MLRIRLRKPGKSVKRRYHFKIVVMEAKRARDSRFVDSIGYYDPSRNMIKFDIKKYDAWIKKGAQPTETVASLFKRYNKQNKETQNQ
jgi:small subunit ribosomal protein S16